jgi:hypothetical protein
VLKRGVSSPRVDEVSTVLPVATVVDVSFADSDVKEELSIPLVKVTECVDKSEPMECSVVEYSAVAFTVEFSPSRCVVESTFCVVEILFDGVSVEREVTVDIPISVLEMP